MILFLSILLIVLVFIIGVVFIIEFFVNNNCGALIVGIMALFWGIALSLDIVNPKETYLYTIVINGTIYESNDVTVTDTTLMFSTDDVTTVTIDLTNENLKYEIIRN